MSSRRSRGTSKIGRPPAGPQTVSQDRCWSPPATCRLPTSNSMPIQWDPTYRERTYSRIARPASSGNFHSPWSSSPQGFPHRTGPLAAVGGGSLESPGFRIVPSRSNRYSPPPFLEPMTQGLGDKRGCDTPRPERTTRSQPHLPTFSALLQHFSGLVQERLKQLGRLCRFGRLHRMSIWDPIFACPLPSLLVVGRLPSIRYRVVISSQPALWKTPTTWAGHTPTPVG